MYYEVCYKTYKCEMHAKKRNNAMVKASSTEMSKANCIYGFRWKNLKKRDHLEDLNIDNVKVKIILKEQDGCVPNLPGAG
jgi:hypothetical protein